MLEKSRVSIFFLSDRIQILQLSSSKKKVIKHASVSLPEGVVKVHQVQDKKILSQILKSTWSKLHLREKSVGIVIPEFSTFTKFMSLPKINLQELDEAVRWQSQDFLPSDPKSMVMDWKIVESTKDNYSVLLVAMEREILEGYVESAEMAGLFPMDVETPSLSLVRLVGDNEGKLIVYDNFDEEILVVSQGKKVVGSSVVSGNDSDEIAKTARKIVSYYKDIKIDKVYVGGIDLGSDLPQKLEKEVNKPTNWIRPTVKGLTAEGIQEYLIPIALQFKESSEPADPATINLLPEHLVGKYKRAKTRLQVWSLTLTTSFFIWMLFLSTLGAYFYISQLATGYKQRNALQSGITQKRKEAVAQVKDINTVSNDVLQIQKASILPQTVLNAIARAKPATVSITAYDLDFEKGLMKLQGVAGDRLGLIQFKQDLENNPDISTVEIPVSSFEVETNLNFQATFEYLPVSSPVKAQQKGVK